jgi:hypothetical protein
VLSCVVDHIRQEFNILFVTRCRTYKIATSPQTKMTRKDNILGLVSLKVPKREIFDRSDFPDFTP